MYYISTRGKSKPVTPSQAILNGLADDGGLYLPSELPRTDEKFLSDLCKMDYVHRVSKILSLFLTDYSEEELLGYAVSAYSKFDDPSNPAPVVCLGDQVYSLELFHGPTCAFKDFALTMLPYLLTGAMKKNKVTDEILILVATSGDTGKAALAGFADVPGTKITVFFPEDGVSRVQKLQMITQTGNNVNVFAVKGNFDDAQRGVKRCFSDPDLKAELKKQNISFSSANSINWGRLAPQIVYYYSAYCDLVNAGTIRPGDPIDFCVPTGNFGDILAGWYAKKCGLPVDKLICASNSNNVLTDFIRTGTYDRKRTFYKTSSPSMDILVSSNIERLISELSGHNGALISDLMNQLNENGEYSLPEDIFRQISENFLADFTDDADTYQSIRETYQQSSWLPDTHTAVALSVLKSLRSNPDKVSVVVSTASPFKFSPDVNAALDGNSSRPEKDRGTEELNILSDRTGLRVPEPLSGLDKRTVRFSETVDPERMSDAVRNGLSK